MPARTALGLVYVKDAGKGPVLAFHMWTEVWVQGQWMGIDAVWGEGGVGAEPSEDHRPFLERHADAGAAGRGDARHGQDQGRGDGGEIKVV